MNDNISTNAGESTPGSDQKQEQTGKPPGDEPIRDRWRREHDASSHRGEIDSTMKASIDASADSRNNPIDSPSVANQQVDLGAAASAITRQVVDSLRGSKKVESRPASSLPSFYHRKDSAGNTMSELLVQRDSASGKAKREIKQQIQAWTKEFNAPQNQGSAANSGSQGKVPDGNIRAKWKTAKEAEKSVPESKPVAPPAPMPQTVIAPPVVRPPVVAPPIDPSIPQRWRQETSSQPKLSEADRNREAMQTVTASQGKASAGEKPIPQPQTSTPVNGTIWQSISKVFRGGRANAQPGSPKPEPSANSDRLDRLQLGLDVAGVAGDVAGGAGAIADGTNAAISIGRAWKEPERRKEHIFNAGVSAVSMIPFVGDLAKGFKAKGAARTTKRTAAGFSTWLEKGRKQRSENLSRHIEEPSKDDQPKYDFDTKPWLGDSINDFTESVKSGKPLPVKKGKEPSLAEMQKNSVSGADAARTFAEHGGAYNGKTGEMDVLKMAQAMEEMTKQHAKLKQNQPASDPEKRSPAIGDPKRNETGNAGGNGGGDNPPRTGGTGDEEENGKRSFVKFKEGLKSSGEKLLGLVPVVGKVASAAAGFVGGLKNINAGVLALNRDLEKFNGRIAQAYAKSDVRDIQREVKKGESLDGPLSRLAESQSELKDNMSRLMVPIEALLINLLDVATNIANYTLSAAKADPELQKAFDALLEAHRQENEKNNTAFENFFQDTADGKLDGKKPKF